ncbi:MAG: tetratricopeptide repeat protein [bacterium]|nr:tetratricopeptide repeat protein [bacterium]
MKTSNNKKYHGKLLCGLFMLSILFVVGCSGGDYEAEKLYWKANKMYVKLLKDPQNAKPRDYENIIVAYQKIVFKFPRWAFSPRAQLTIGQLYAMQNNMSKAKAEYEKVLKHFSNDQNSCAGALFAIGKIYEFEDKWDKALEKYNKIVSDYPNTYASFQVPLYIAQYYKAKGLELKAQNAYKEAIAHYSKIIKEHPDTFASLTAQNFIVAVLIEQQKWDEVLKNLRNLADSYPGTAVAAESLNTMAGIYVNQLNEPEKGAEILKELLEKFPQVGARELIEEKIETLKLINN